MEDKEDKEDKTHISCKECKECKGSKGSKGFKGFKGSLGSTHTIKYHDTKHPKGSKGFKACMTCKGIMCCNAFFNLVMQNIQGSLRIKVIQGTREGKDPKEANDIRIHVITHITITKESKGSKGIPKESTAIHSNPREPKKAKGSPHRKPKGAKESQLKTIQNK